MHKHIHSFTKETALETLKDVGYELLDYLFAPPCLELGENPVQKTARLPRKICVTIHQNLTVRILGGYGLRVLAK